MTFDPKDYQAVDPMNPRLRAVFRMWDMDGSGELDTRELRTLLRAMGMWQGYTDLQQKVRECDVNGDGKIDYREFCLLFEATAKRTSPIFKDYQPLPPPASVTPSVASRSSAGPKSPPVKSPRPESKNFNYTEIMNEQRAELAQNPLSQHIYGDTNQTKWRM
jgi:hypothetical protein